MIDLKFIAIDSKEPQNTQGLAADACHSNRMLYQQTSFEPPWIGYLAVDRTGNYVGTCAFKKPPQDGKVEIAYFTFPEYQKKGIAGQMARYLVQTARKAEAKIIVYAHTLPAMNPSNRILKKLGFKYTGTVEHPEDGSVWQWTL